MRVTEVSGRSGVRRFLRVAKRIYPSSSPWVAPLDLERRRFFHPLRNPFFHHATLELFIAMDGAGRDVGRIAAIDNPRHNEFQGEHVAFFGFFEAIEDSDVARELLKASSTWAAGRGYSLIRGPVNPSTNHECGLLVGGFEHSPMVQMPYNHPYYERLLLEAGCRGVQDMVAFHYPVGNQVPERLARGDEIFRKRHAFSVRCVDMKNFEEELGKVKLIYNEAWAHNYGFVPLTDAEIDYVAGDLRSFIDPAFCYMAEVKGEPAAFSMTLPDVNQALRPLRGRLVPFGWLKLLLGLRRIDGLRAMALGVRPRYRKMGIDYTLYLKGLQTAQVKGFRDIEVSWVLADNVKLTRPMEHFGARVYKTYRLYEKDVD